MSLPRIHTHICYISDMDGDYAILSVQTLLGNGSPGRGITGESDIVIKSSLSVSLVSEAVLI